MWAGSLLLRLGEQRDVLVAVQADSEASLDQLRHLLAAWIELQLPDNRRLAVPALSVRLEPVPDRHHLRTAGPKPVPQLRYGSSVQARSRQPDDIVAALTAVLGGIHTRRRDDGRLWINLRPFVSDGSVVLVDADRPALVNDRRLAAGGIDELAAWSVAIDPDGTVAIPPPLADSAQGTSDWQRFELAGIVALREGDTTHQQLVTELNRRSVQSHWSDLVDRSNRAGQLAVGTDQASARDHVAALFAAARTTTG